MFSIFTNGDWSIYLHHQIGSFPQFSRYEFPKSWKPPAAGDFIVMRVLPQLNTCFQRPSRPKNQKSWPREGWPSATWRPRAPHRMRGGERCSYPSVSRNSSKSLKFLVCFQQRKMVPSPKRWFLETNSSSLNEVGWAKVTLQLFVNMQNHNLAHVHLKYFRVILS